MKELWVCCCLGWSLLVVVEGSLSCGGVRPCESFRSAVNHIIVPCRYGAQGLSGDDHVLRCHSLHSLPLNNIINNDDDRPRDDSSWTLLTTTTTTEPMIGTTLFSKTIFFMLGIALMIGGAYDAWMPVYATGPNIITSAGIGQDAAMGLFIGTLLQMIRIQLSSLLLLPSGTHHEEIVDRTSSTITSSPPRRPPLAGSTGTSSPMTLVLYILLLAQLYKLGEGSFDELLFTSSNLVP